MVLEIRLYFFFFASFFSSILYLLPTRTLFFFTSSSETSRAPFTSFPTPLCSSPSDSKPVYRHPETRSLRKIRQFSRSQQRKLFELYNRDGNSAAGKFEEKKKSSFGIQIRCFRNFSPYFRFIFSLIGDNGLNRSDEGLQRGKLVWSENPSPSKNALLPTKGEDDGDFR